MPRKPDPTRKPELLGQILEHLTTRTLATVSFRTLAEALGVSTYVFVYHFGNRAQLLAEIVRAVVARQSRALEVDPVSLDGVAWATVMRAAWADASSDYGRQLQRLEFEAAMIEMVEGDERGVARVSVAAWRDFVASWVRSRGVDSAPAAVEAQLFTAAVYGLQYDALATGDSDRVAAAFDRHLGRFVDRVDRMVAAG